MKYWFFDGNDVVGPFTPKELAVRPGFAETSLVCPENFSENEDNWKIASSFLDFHFDSKEAFPSQPPEPDENTDSFDEEMDTLLKERSPLAEPEENAAEAPSLEIPKKPAKPGPIEDYFNNIKGEDLGNILGIPDPNENSDMNLARALETQFNKTAPPTDKEIQPIEDDPFDEFTSDAAEEADELFPAEAAPAAEPQPSVPAPAPAPTPAQEAAPQKQEPKAAQVETEKPQLQAEQTSKQEISNKLPRAKKQPGPASVPISAAPEDELILTVRRELPLENTPQKESVPAPTEQEQAPAGPAPLDEADAPTFSLPVLGQPETELPPVPAEEIPFEAVLNESEPASPTPQDVQTPQAEAPQTPAETSAPQEEPNGQTLTAETKPAEEVKDAPEEPRETNLSEAAPQTPEAPASAPQPEAASHPSNTAPEEPRETAPAEESAPQEPAQEEQPEELVPQAAEEEPKDPKEETVRNILKGELEVVPAPELEEPIKNVPVEPQINQVKPRLSQTPEIEEFLTQTQNERIARTRSNKKAKAALSVLAALLAVGAAFFINQTVAQEPAPSPAPKTGVLPPPANAKLPDGPEVEELLPDIPVPPPAPQAQPSLSDKALAVVQNYQLSGSRGTIASYFDRLYQTKKAQGYTSSWSAEPLHKSTYIVKYRLTKTRMEPIVYVFQADAASGKLTGALNNIALDLVGKIQ